MQCMSESGQRLQGVLLSFNKELRLRIVIGSASTPDFKRHRDPNWKTRVSTIKELTAWVGGCWATGYEALALPVCNEV